MLHSGQHRSIAPSVARRQRLLPELAVSHRCAPVHCWALRGWDQRSMWLALSLHLWLQAGSRAAEACGEVALLGGPLFQLRCLTSLAPHVL